MKWDISYSSIFRNKSDRIESITIILNQVITCAWPAFDVPGFSSPVFTVACIYRIYESINIKMYLFKLLEANQIKSNHLNHFESNQLQSDWIRLSPARRVSSTCSVSVRRRRPRSPCCPVFIDFMNLSKFIYSNVQLEANQIKLNLIWFYQILTGTKSYRITCFNRLIVRRLL